jgi:mono/diheme cytochrome c family protein
MKRLYWFGLLTVLVLVITPLSVAAQDDKSDDFESEDGLLTLSYPTGWVASEDVGFLPTFMAGTTEHALEQMNQDILMPESGDTMLFVMIVPSDLLSMMGMEPDSDTSIVDLTTLVATAFLTPEDPESGDVPEFGETEEVELDDEQTIGYVEFTQEYTSGAFMLRQLSDDMLVITLIGTPLDEFSEDVAAIGQQTIASVDYAGTSGDILAAMMAPPEIEEAPDGVTAADLDGEALVAERCTVCHSADRINNAVKDEAGWTATVDRMISYGADLNTAEREAVITYLSSK